MPRQKKCPPKGASKAYLVSFGGTMTALLAFFIVLNSLSEDQSGGDLNTGTGSFVQALDGFGLPSHFQGNRSAQAFQGDERSPQYLIPGEEDSDEFSRTQPAPSRQWPLYKCCRHQPVRANGVLKYANPCKAAMRESARASRR